jgi:hypothetical protein
MAGMYVTDLTYMLLCNTARKRCVFVSTEHEKGE